MAKQRVVNTRFWDDGYITTLGPTEKLVFLYVLTNPLTDLCGAYEITVRRIVHDTGIKESKLLSIFAEFERVDKIIYKDGWMIVRNFAKHQVSNPKVSRGIERSLNDCPDWVKDRLSKPIVDYRTLTSRENPNLRGQPEPEPADARASQIQPADEWDAVDAHALGYPLADLLKFFPRVTLTTGQVGLIQAEVKDTPLDREAWSETIKQYVGNHDPATKSYLPQKVGNLLSVFKSKRAELEKQKNGTHQRNQKRTDQDVIAESADFYDTYPA